MKKIDPYRYYSIKKRASSQIIVEGSRFIGTAAPAATEEKVRIFIDKIKTEYHDATHNTYAYRLGPPANSLEGFSDDREPAGTAGFSMLQLLHGEGLSDMAIVVTRYFGGVKLGIGGLTRAYRSCARACLEECELVFREQLARYRFTTAYSEFDAVRRHIQSLGGEIIKVDYTEEIKLTAALPVRAVRETEEGLKDISRGKTRLERIEE